MQDLTTEIVDRIRANPPENHPGETIYFSGPDFAVFPETGPSPSASQAEDTVAKVFNCHTEGLARELAEDKSITGKVADLIGTNLVCFQSQFILKNPGVIGQPWHQDSYYFRFDRQPQIGVWVALSPATRENGCLWVLPGSHRAEVHPHEPDRRPTANRGYLEILNQNTDAKIPVLMQPGDVLFFHSYLMHMSTDNMASERRAAIVYHYGRAGTQAVSEQVTANLAHVNRWLPIK